VQLQEVIERLQAFANPANIEGMARYGISTENALGIPHPPLKALAREIGRNHELAQELWATGIKEARHLASLLEDTRLVSEEQMERWAADFDSWDICDDCCGLFARTPFAYEKAFEWRERVD
jgi:3-methyladenine DNA glycosylase AlkD